MMLELPSLVWQEWLSLFSYYESLGAALILLLPFFLFFEVPMFFVVTLGVVRWYLTKLHRVPAVGHYVPRVSCLVICYNEGEVVQKTLRTLCEQVYPGEIELIPVLDGAAQNLDTLQGVRDFKLDKRLYPNRSIRPIAKWQRGGRVSSLNAGLQIATGEVVLVMDADTTFDNNTVSALVPHFADPMVPAVAGSLRVGNPTSSLITRLQELEYFLTIHTSKTGLSEWNTINNVSGAFGAFRREFLERIGGWDTHTAEDLDLTLRIKSYFGRHPYRIPFEPAAVGHTDVPDTLGKFLKQRLRWDGDLFFLYVRKHSENMSPRLMGWRNFFMTLFTGFFFQMVVPFLIVLYTLAILFLLPAAKVLALGVLLYLVYLGATVLLYLLGMLLVSERPKQDLRMLLVLPVYPFFTFCTRCWSAVCILNEIFRRGHEESSMAPWWVTKRGKRF